MSKKDLIAKLLSKLSEEELTELLSDDSSEGEAEDDGRHVIKRRGSGHSKKNRKSKKTAKAKRSTADQGSGKGSGCRTQQMDLGKRKNKFEDFMTNISLDASESRELAQASKDDETLRETVKPRRKQKRQSTLIEVRCSSCNKDFTVSRSIVASADRWKCNSCCCSGR
jgi:hypothetical protein